MDEPPPTVDNATFVKMYQAAESLDDLATELRLTKHHVERIAGKMRKAGVKLKPMRKPNAVRAPLNEAEVAALNALIEAK